MIVHYCELSFSCLANTKRCFQETHLWFQELTDALEAKDLIGVWQSCQEPDPHCLANITGHLSSNCERVASTVNQSSMKSAIKNWYLYSKGHWSTSPPTVDLVWWDKSSVFLVEQMNQGKIIMQKELMIYSNVIDMTLISWQPYYSLSFMLKRVKLIQSRFEHC